MQAARWPDLDVVCAMLPRIWFDPATYGRRALDLAMSTYGVEPMLFGSDMPGIDPLPALGVIRSFGEAPTDVVLTANPHHLPSRSTSTALRCGEWGTTTTTSIKS